MREGRCLWLTIWLHFLFFVVCGGADCVCRACFAGYFCEEATSWVVGARSFRHLMAVVWGGLGEVIGIEPTESDSWLLLGWSFFVTSIFFSSVRLPRHLHLGLSQHILQNVGRFGLKAHTLKAKTAL